MDFPESTCPTTTRFSSSFFDSDDFLDLSYSAITSTLPFLIGTARASDCREAVESLGLSEADDSLGLN